MREARLVLGVSVSKPLPPPTPAPKPAAPSERRETLAEAIQRYVGIIAEAKSLKTASAYRYTLEHGNQRLIFPNPRTGRSEGHFLRKLKDLAERAGLNPDDCGLHKFRKSYATLQHENGTSARTIQRRLGHSALETTLAYLEAADVQSEETKSERGVRGVS